MQDKYTLLIRISLFLGLFFFSASLYAEGTKQLSPTVNDRVNLNIASTGYNSFGRYDGADNQRLYIHIKNPATEQVFLGFSQPRNSAAYPCTTGDVTAYFRIKNAAGTVVFPTPGNANGQAITASIAGWANAVAGPNQIVGTGGYNAVVFNPAAYPAGDYYVEFSKTQGAYNSAAFAIEWWDITVATKATTPVAINGRVFSKNWAFYTPSINCSAPTSVCTSANQFGAYDRAFNGSFHVYSPADSVVTKVNFNNSGLQPIAFNLFFNDRGPGNTGNIATDRKSVVASLAGTSLYPLFLNDPDATDYPSGTTGTYTTEPYYISCDNKTGQFFVNVTKAGQVDILIDFDKTSGAFKYDPGTRDVALAIKVTPAIGELPPYRRSVIWNGKDGLGAQVNLGTPIDYAIKYSQGVFHLPIFDAEFMTTGFSFSAVRPIPPPGAVAVNSYYDDSNIVDTAYNTNPKIQLNGCVSPCHKWNNYCYGNNNTINTWFFGSEQQVTKTATLPVCLTEAINDTATVATPSIALYVLSNDYGISMDSSSISTIGLPQPLHGSIAVNALLRKITYTPTVGYAGKDSFRYRICDSNSYTCDTAWVILTMPANAGFTFNCGTASTTGTFTANATAAQTGTLTVPMTGATAGSVTLTVAGTGFSGTLTTTLTAGQTSVSVPITYDGTGAAGSRTLTVTSSQATGTCTPSVSVVCPTIAAPTTSVVQPTCSVATGTITVTSPASGVTYSFNNGSTYQASATSSALAAGTYQVVVKNSTSNCTSAAASATINPQPVTPSVPTTSVVQPTCSVATGTITVTSPASGVTYSFNNGSTYQASATSSALAAGTYQVVVKSSTSNCVSLATSATINPQPVTPSVPTVSLTQPSCSVSTGTITVTAPTGTGMTYSIDGVDYSNTTGVFNNVSPNTYMVTARSSGGCTSGNTSATINPLVTTPVVTITQPNCSTATGGAIVTTPTGAGFMYSIDGVDYSNTTGQFNNLAPNSYTITVQNSSGCTSAGTTFTIHPPVQTPIVSLTQPTCSVATGTIKVTTPSAGVVYSFDNGVSYQAADSLNGLAAGAYQVIAKDATQGCLSATTSATLNPQPVTPSVPTLNLTQPTCSTATGTIKITSPSSGVTYSFDNGATYQAIDSLSGLDAAVYQVIVKNNVGGCASSATSATLNPQPATPSVPTLNLTQPTCSSATGTIKVASPSSGVTYSFDNGATYQAIDSLSGLVAAVYQVIVKNNIGGCLSLATSATIDPQPTVPSVPTLATTQPTCTLATGTILITSATTGETYSFDNGATYQAADSLSGLVAGVYAMIVQNSTSGCVSVANMTTINAQPLPPSVPTTSVSQPTCTVATGTITITNPASGVTYSFDNGTTYQTTLISSALPSGTYQIVAKDTLSTCVSSANSTTVNPQPAVVSTPIVTLTQPTCSVATGTLTITAPTGTGISYSIDGVDYTNTTGIFSNVIAGSYTITAQSAAGCISTASLDTLYPLVSFDIKVLLEGPYQTVTGTMQTLLNQRGLLPGQTPFGQFGIATSSGQPFNGAPWNYAGTEGDTITTYPATVVDWILVSLRTDSTSATTVFQTAGWLHEDGTVTFPTPCFTIANGNYFILIEHRNHVGVLSPTRVSVQNGVLTQDFTASDSYITTNPPSFGQKLKGSKWVMYAGDGKKDTPTTNYDINFNDAQLWKLQSGIFDQYIYGDFNMDADVNFSDSFLWKLNNGRYSGVPH